MKKEIRENIKELVNYCRNGGVASIATDMYDFDWYVLRECSPYEAYVPKDAICVEKDILKMMKALGLKRNEAYELINQLQNK